MSHTEMKIKTSQTGNCTKMKGNTMNRITMTKMITAASALLLVFALTFSLGACMKGKDGAPMGLQLASMEEAEYRFYVPDEWTVDLSTGIASAYVSEANRTNLSLTAYELTDDVKTIDDYWAKYEAGFAEIFSDYELLGSENILLDSFGAKTYEYKASLGGIGYHFSQTICIHGETVYIITYTAGSDQLFDDHFEDYAVAIQFFKFV